MYKTSSAAGFLRSYLGKVKYLGIYVLLFISISLVTLSSRDNAAVRFAANTLSAVFMPVVDVFLNPLNIFVDSANFVSDFIFTYSNNKELRTKLVELQKKSLIAENILNENEELKKLLNFTKTNFVDYRTGRVILSSNNPYTRLAAVNLGSVDGIKKGQVAMSRYGLAGRITNIGRKKSDMMLITDINSRIPVITSQTRQRAILAGNNTEAVNLLYLSKGSKLIDGETVVTSGDGDMLPMGLLVGKVKVDDGRARVIPFASWNKLEVVTIVDYLVVEGE